MRVLFSTQPSTGHFHPLVPLASALEHAGHEVAFAASEFFCQSVTASGFGCIPAGFDIGTHWSTASIQSAFPEFNTEWPGPERVRWIMANLFAGKMTEQRIPDLVRIASAWQPDLRVREPFEFAACLVGELSGVPYATAGWGVFLSSETWVERVGEPLNSHRRHYGLPTDQHLSMLHRFLYLAAVPPEFVGNDDHISPTVHFMRPVPFDTSGDERLPGWVADLPERPTIYATLGTVFNDQPAIFQLILEAFNDAPVNLILTVGRDQDPGAYGPQPPHIRIERYIPQSLLLPHCDLVLTHGGFNSALSALSAGVPLVAMPLGADQFKNAGRAERTGAARVVLPDERTATSIRVAADEVLTRPSYRERANAFRQSLEAIPGLDHAVRLLERLAVEKQPIIADRAATIEGGGG